jgi:ribonuclease BN (tRNA processing enzyme)
MRQSPGDPRSATAKAVALRKVPAPIPGWLQKMASRRPDRGAGRVRVVGMRLTVLGACGAWPEPGQACSGFLVEQDGFRLVVDLGYATVPRLLELLDAAQVDAVVISHGHPDHCADLNPLLRARAMRDDPAPPLPVYAPAGALDAVLRLDQGQTLAGSYQVHDLASGASLEIGPLRVQTRQLPHWLPNLGVRLAAEGRTLAYTGDTGPSQEVVRLAAGADLLLAEATYLDPAPRDAARCLSTASVAGRQAAQAEAGRLLLTHLWPGADRCAYLQAASAEYPCEVDLATPGLRTDLG